MKRTSGFTLIELLVVVGIILVLSAIALPTLRNFGKGKSLENAGKIIQNVIASARSGAAKLRIPHRVIFFTENDRVGLVVYAKGKGFVRDPVLLPEGVRIDDSKSKPVISRGGDFGRGPNIGIGGPIDINKPPRRGPPPRPTAQPLRNDSIKIFEGRPDPEDTALDSPDGVITANHLGKLEIGKWDTDIPPPSESGISFFNPDSTATVVKPGTRADLRLLGPTDKNVLLIDLDPYLGKAEFIVLPQDEN